MPVVVITRLRLKDPALFDEFFASAVAAVEQAQGSSGNISADVLADANNTYWTRTTWQERGAMHAYVGAEPHRSIMRRLDDWCDEATFVDWEQASADIPDWLASYARLITDGQAASLSQPSDAHQSRKFPAPVASS
jgi:quinol monooxygenase YgiN